MPKPKPKAKTTNAIGGKTKTPPKAVGKPATSRDPAPKRGAKGNDFSINEVDFPAISRIGTEDDIVREINTFAKGGRKFALENALTVAAIFQRGIDLGIVRWGSHKPFIEKHLDYSQGEVTKFRRLLSERPIMGRANEWYEENKAILKFPRRKSAGVDFQVQVNRAFLKFDKLIRGSTKEPALDPDAALERVDEEMTPKPGGKGNATTTVKQREAILFLLAVHSSKDRSVMTNWTTPNELSVWLLTVHPDIREALLDEATLLSDHFGGAAFAKIAYPDRMKKLWGWKQGMVPDTGEDEDFGGKNDQEPADPDALKLTETPKFPYPVEGVSDPDELQQNWDYLTRFFSVTAKQIATWNGMKKTAKALRAKVHPDRGNDELDAQKVGGALDSLLEHHPQNPQNKPPENPQDNPQNNPSAEAA